MAKANAGPDSTICANESSYAVRFCRITRIQSLWKSDGDGTFDDVRIIKCYLYTRDQMIYSKGFVWLRLTAYDSLPCETSNTDKVKITIDDCTGISEGTEKQFSLKGCS